MAAKLKPLGDRIVVRRSEAEEKTAGGIVLPDSAKDKPKQGSVVSVGPGRVLDSGETKKIDVKAGDIVLFGAYAGSDVKIGPDEYLILSESDVLGVLDDAAGKKKK